MLTGPFRMVIRSLMDLVDRDDAMHVDQSPFSRGLAWLTLPFRLLWGFLVFMVQAWPPSRSGVAFLKGGPAVLGLGVFSVGLLTADLLMTEARRIGTTQGYLAYQVSNSPDQPEYAMIFAEKLVELKPDNPEHLYQLGLAYDRLDNAVKANDIMSFIAFDNRPGYALAHVWRSQFYLRSKLVKLDLESREELARKHLGLAVEVSPDSQAANFDLAQLYLSQAARMEKGSAEYIAILELAIENLGTVADGNLTGIRLMAVPQMVELQLELGKDDDARRRLNNEIITLQTIARRRPDIYEIWFAMIKCAILLKDYPEAVRIVSQGIQLANDNETKRKIYQLASHIYVEKSGDFTDMSNRTQYRNRLNSLCEAIRLNQTNRIVYLKMLDFIGKKRTAEPIVDQSTKNKQQDSVAGRRIDFSGANDLWLNDSIVGCPAPGVVHALLGMREISKGNVSEGEKHWRMAEQQFQRTQFVINNLIDVAAKERPDEFSNILDMVTLGIELFPDQPVFYQTRGVFLLNQGKIDEAIKDLVYASEQLPSMISLHKYLITCYEKLGDDQKALEQEIILEAKLNELDAIDRRRVEEAIRRLD